MSAANLLKSLEAWVDLGPKVGTKAYHRHHGYRDTLFITRALLRYLEIHP